jgi:3-carboxy-cis,cis-muconate cycloisomerase
MGQQHERGLGNWQAELAEWPGLFLSAHGALAALNEAIGGLLIDPARMRTNIDALGGLVFAEAVAGYLAGFIGRPAAHAMLEQLSRNAVESGRHLAEVASDAIDADPVLRTQVDLAHWQSLFDAVAAAAPGAAAARALLQHLHELQRKDETT